MYSKFNGKIRKVLYGIMLLGIMVSTFGSSNPTAARANNYSIKTQKSTIPFSYMLASQKQLLAELNSPPPPPEQYKSLGQTQSKDFYHSGLDSTVHVVDQIGSPYVGVQTITLPTMTKNISITADGVAITYTLITDPTNPEMVIEVNVPANTNLLKLEYDQLDSAIAFEGVWYLAHRWVWGPMTMTVHLPANANIERYHDENIAHLIDSHTIQFDVPDGTPIFPIVVYDTPVVPQMYNEIFTTHFNVYIPSVYQKYQDSVISLLENAYELYHQYSQQDINQLFNHSHYDYYFLPCGWYWWGSTIELGGGLTVAGGPSAVQSNSIPTISLPTSANYNFFVEYMFHELGNGWWKLWGSRGLPWWIDTEAHSGFLRGQAELDMNYCIDNQRGYSEAYQGYLQCRQDQPGVGHCNPEIILTSLLQKYGWSPFRSIYAAVQNGTLDLNGLSDSEKDSQMVLFFSQQVNENLVNFFEGQWIHTSTAVQQQLSSLPVGNVPILSSLDCRPLTLRYTPSALEFAGAVGQQNLEPQKIYISSPVSWTGNISPKVSWLSISRSSSSNTGYETAIINTTGLSAGQYSTILVLDTQSAISNSPGNIPITLYVTNNVYLPLIYRDFSYINLVQNPDFEDGIYDPSQPPPNWAKDFFLATATLNWDNTQSHSGTKSVRIDSPSANDVRWIQTVSVSQNTNYKLSGWIKTMNVVHSDGPVVAGANLGLNGTWDHTDGLFGTNDWTQVSMEFNSGNNITVTVACRLGYWSGTATGTMWCDDIELTLKY